MVAEKDSYPLPRIDATLDAFKGSSAFSTLDLKSGYWQIELDPEHQAKTAFVVPSGPYEFETMPFGLSNAPATFQRLMNHILRDLIPKSGLVYMDDVIIHSASFNEHLDRLKAVLHRLQTAGLKLNPAKCFFSKGR